MALVLKNRVKSTTTTTGTGTITLGSAATGFQDFSVIGNGNETYYLITDNINWESGVGTYNSSGTTLSRNRVFASSNSNALVDWSAGTKTVLCGYPSEGTSGGIPFFDNSTINSTLSAWQAIKPLLESGYTGGQVFDNGNLGGVSSTFSLVYTVGNNNVGAVLDANGAVHFVPSDGVIGQKVSLNGIVSTYSLVYTGARYDSGVLAPNGDVHFIPNTAVVGQKISPSGVVSTYSLVYTGGIYSGGVVAPNGDIHFIPLSAPVGQKVSASGTVSTYSLVYTTSNAYSGGCLAPNGEIHFCPRTPTVGQKISTAGVVSTYSLARTATTTRDYEGAVLDINGDIHFVPSNTTIGQKVNPFTGVVSTYALALTTNAECFSGVLAPNGYVYFINRAANGKGQRVSPNGVVSSYAILPTNGNNFGFIGGVLNANGEIIIAPYTLTVGHKITISPGQLFGPGVVSSPFFNQT